MCIGLPMQVLSATPHAALADGRGRQEVVDTRLVGPCAAGDWLLVFHGAARERLDAGRAREIDAVLDLLEAALTAPTVPTVQQGAPAEPGFELPSRMSAAELAALTSRR